MIADTPTPRLGDITGPLYCNRVVAGTLDDPTDCGRDATWHIIWDNDSAGLACDEHAADARRRYVYVGMHPYEMVCSIPGARWLSDEDRCVVDDDDLGLDAGAELALATPTEGAPHA